MGANRIGMDGSVVVEGPLTFIQCAPGMCRDNKPHDFGWATYSDATTSYGVCRCGYDEYTHAMLTLP